MKVQKVISLDYELVVKLKGESNASGLINDLLLNYYRVQKEGLASPETQAKYNELLAEKKARATNIKERKLEIGRLRKQMEAGKITEKEFWRFVDGE